MPRETARLTFRGDSFKDPVIYEMGKNYNLVTNIARAKADEGAGWVELILDGRSEDIEAALDYARSRGVDVERVK